RRAASAGFSGGGSGRAPSRPRWLRRSRLPSVASSRRSARSRRLRNLSTPAASSMTARRSLACAVSTSSSCPCPTMTCCWRPMPVSESSSWMSRRRHVTPLSWYSESPSRKRVRVIVTSENSIGRRGAVLSMVSDTSARPRAERSGVPAKMTSSIRPPRRVRGPWAPRTHATASTRFDLPDPFGPTTTVTPGSNWSRVLSAKDLKPRRLSDLRNTRPALLCATWAAVGWYLRGSRSPGTLRREIRPLPDPKALLPDWRFLEHLNVVDAGTRRPVPAPRHHRVDGGGRALEHDLDPSVVEVAHPA